MLVNDKVGLVLSGGGFRGLAQLGVIKYMRELGLDIDLISGTSAGAIFGSLVANGYEPEEILGFCKKEKFFSYSNISIKNGGFFSADILEKLIKKYIPHDDFDALQLPFYATATDLTNGRALTFDQGSISFAVKASSCFPLVFQPVEYGDVYLCDGGLMDNFPIGPLKSSCRYFIGVNVNPINISEGKFGYKGLISRIIRIATSTLNHEDTSACNIYIEPNNINQFTTFDVQRLDEIFQLGYACAQKFEADFKAIMLDKKNVVIVPPHPN